MTTYREHVRATLRARYAAFAAILFTPLAMASETPRIWRELYKELHGGGPPAWKGVADAEAWAKQNEARLEPVVLQGLRGEHAGKPWSEYLTVARVLPTDAVCAALLAKTDEIMARHPDKRIPKNSADEVLAWLIDILSRAKKERIRDVAAELVSQEDQSYSIVEAGVRALQHLGNETSLPRLRAVPLRRADPWIDRMCGLAEKMIGARIRGQSVFTDAPAQLRALIERYLSAINHRDYAAYIAVKPFSFERAEDEAEVTREIFDNEEVRPIFRDLEKAIDQPFTFHEDDLQADLTFGDGRYQLSCLLEVDGWKIGSVTRIAP
jgi:hypothetical protein